MSEEDKKLLLEMKSNCLEDRGTSRITYNDEKRIKKAKAIDNALKEIERLNNIENDLLDRYYGRGKYHLSTDIIGIPTFYKRIKELKEGIKGE